MGVGGDPQAPLMRLIGYYAQFTFGKLLLARFGIARKHAACGAHLDDFSAKIAQVHRSRRAGHEIADVQHAQVAQRTLSIGFLHRLHTPI